MKSILSAIVALFVSIFGFGGHQAVTHSAASAAVAAATAGVAPSAIVVAASSTSQSTASSTAASTTTIYQPIIERIVNQQTTSTGVSRSYLDTRLGALDQSLRQFVSRTASTPIFSGPSAPLSAEAFAPSQRIDKLTNATLNNVTVNGVSGLTAADIPALSSLNGVLGVSQGGTGTTTATGGLSALQFLGNWTGAVARSAGEKLSDTVSVKDFGAKGDGATDDTAAIQAALNYACTASGVTPHQLYVSDGVYKITDKLSLPATEKCDISGPGKIVQYTNNKPIFYIANPSTNGFKISGLFLTWHVAQNSSQTNSVAIQFDCPGCTSGQLASGMYNFELSNLFIENAYRAIANANSVNVWGSNIHDISYLLGSGAFLHLDSGGSGASPNLRLANIYINPIGGTISEPVIYINPPDQLQIDNVEINNATLSGDFIFLGYGLRGASIRNIRAEQVTLAGDYIALIDTTSPISVDGVTMQNITVTQNATNNRTTYTIRVQSSGAGMVSRAENFTYIQPFNVFGSYGQHVVFGTNGVPNAVKLAININRTAGVVWTYDYPPVMNLLDTSGNVGIGTTTPWAKLSVDTSNLAAGAPEFSIGSTTRQDFVVTQAGNVGIGTTTPGSILSVQGVANWTTATSTYYSTGGINLAAGCFAIGGNCLSLGNISGTLAVNQGGTASTTLTGLLKGNGTGSVLTAVAGTDYQFPLSFTYPLLNINNTVSEAWGTTTVNTWSLLQTLTSGFVSNSSSTVVGSFTTTGIGTFGGNVGIGTSSPSTALSIVGGTNALTLSRASGSLGGLVAFTDQGSHVKARLGIEANANNFFIDNGSATALTILNSNGNVGIGTTSPDTLLSVGSATPVGNVAHFENSTGSCYINPTTTSLSCSSDARLKNNINLLTASSGIAALMQLNPVTYNWNSEATGTPTHGGFIAQQVQPILPDLVSQGPDGYYTLNYAGFTPYLVKAVQELVAEVNALGNTVAGFADSFTTKELTFTRATGDTVTAKHVNTQELCVTDDGGAKTCITKAQLDVLLASAGSSGGGSSASSGSSSGGSSAPDTTPPVITITGDNPAHVSVGTSYADLGASVTDNVDKNLGIKTFLNGALVSNIVIDTSAAATDTIDYVATDNAGNTSTSTRTVIISPAVQADTVTTTPQ